MWLHICVALSREREWERGRESDAPSIPSVSHVYLAALQLEGEHLHGDGQVLLSG